MTKEQAVKLFPHVNFLGDVTIGSDCVCFSGLYKYNISIYKDENTNKVTIRMGCHPRTIQEWDSDFNNNENEFPLGSEQLKKREFAYKIAKMYAIEKWGKI